MARWLESSRCGESRSLRQQLDDPLAILVVDDPGAAVSQANLDRFVGWNRDPQGGLQIQHLMADRHEAARLFGQLCQEVSEERAVIVGFRVEAEVRPFGEMHGQKAAVRVEMNVRNRLQIEMDLPRTCL